MSVMNDKPVRLSQLQLLLRDVRSSLTHWRFWIHLGLEDILKQYRRSYLGPVWISLNTAVFIVAFSMIGSQVFKMDLKEYLVYFCVGHIMFLFISSLVSEGCQTFVAADAFLKQTPYPKVAFVLRVVWRNLINMAHNLPVMLLVLMLYGDLGHPARCADAGFRADAVLGHLAGGLHGAICARFAMFR
jgi:lipopolysaccharide transport system permease protein